MSRYARKSWPSFIGRSIYRREDDLVHRIRFASGKEGYGSLDTACGKWLSARTVKVRRMLVDKPVTCLVCLASEAVVGSHAILATGYNQQTRTTWGVDWANAMTPKKKAPRWARRYRKKWPSRNT